MQAEHRTLDTRRVLRVQPLQLSPHTDRTAATQLLVHSMRDALSGIFDVADPLGSVTMRSHVWVSGWHAPLLKLTKASIMANRDGTHTLHRLVDDVAKLQESLASGVDGPAAFRTLLIDVTDYFDRAPRGAPLETLQKFGAPSGTPFSNYPETKTASTSDTAALNVYVSVPSPFPVMAQGVHLYLLYSQ